MMLLLGLLFLITFVRTLAFATPTNLAQRSQGATPSCTTAAPDPSRSCDLVGYHKIGYKKYQRWATDTFRPANVNTIEDCAYLCARRAYSADNEQDFNFSPSGALFCGGFAYNATNKMCQLFNTPVSTVFSTDKPANGSQTPQTYNDVGCYDCGDLFCATAAGQPLGAQLLDNPGFEKARFGPWGAQGSGGSLVKSQVDGNSYVTMNAVAHVQQGFNTCPGQFYETSFDYKYHPGNLTGTDFTAPSIWLQTDGIQPYAGFSYSWGVGFDHQADTNGAWQRAKIISYKYPPPNSTAYEPNLLGLIFYDTAPKAQGSTVAVDNFLAARRSSTFAPAPGATSVLTNGGFETGGIAPWKLYSANEVFPYMRTRIAANMTSPGLKGSQNALLIKYHTYSYYMLIQENIPTTPGAIYQFSADFYNDFPASQLQYYGNQIDAIVISGGIAQKNTFRDFGGEFNPVNNVTLTWPFYIPGDITTMVLTFGTDEEEGNLYVDNIRLVKQTG